ncbi:MAG: DMT family transporter [Thaumarchaeota archaeon]|nr:DMT family transporter [Nitrososphaerota archaeon]
MASYGLLFAFITALLYGIVPLLIRISLKKVEADAGSFISTFSMLPMYITLALADGEMTVLPTSGYYFLLIFAAQGLIHFVIGRTLNWKSIQLIGAARASQINKTEAIFTMILAYLILSDPLTLPIAIGGLAVITGTLIISKSGDRGTSSKTTAGNFRKGVALGILTGLSWGSSPLLIREGLRTLRLPLGGGLIAAVSGALGLVLMLAATGRISKLRGIPLSSMKYVLAAGAIFSVATVTRILSLVEIPATVFAPIQATSPLFSILFAYLFMRRSESLNILVGLGAAFTVGGSLLIILG